MPGSGDAIIGREALASAGFSAGVMKPLVALVEQGASPERVADRLRATPGIDDAVAPVGCINLGARSNGGDLQRDRICAPDGGGDRAAPPPLTSDLRLPARPGIVACVAELGSGPGGPPPSRVRSHRRLPWEEALENHETAYSVNTRRSAAGMRVCASRTASSARVFAKNPCTVPGQRTS